MVDTNASSCYLPYPSSVAMATINAIFCVLGVIGNSLVLIAVYRTMKLRTLSNFYLVALAVADLLTSAIVQPLLIVLVIQESQGVCIKTLETVFRALKNSSAAISFFILLFITTERLLAVIKPIAYKNFHPKRRFVAFISISVILPLMYTILRLAVSKRATSYLSAAAFLLGYTYIIICYLVILHQLRSQRRKMKTPTSNNERNDVRSTRHAEKVVTSTMVLIITIYTIMWMPGFFFRILKPSTNSGEVYSWLRTTAISNSALNFIVYAFRMKRFRNAFKTALFDGLLTVVQSGTSSTTANP